MIKDDGHYIGVTIIDNILDNVRYSEDACKAGFPLTRFWAARPC